MLALRRLLVPVDFTETSDRALDYAVALAERFQAEVCVLHTYEIPVYGFPDGALVPTGDIAARISEAAQLSLDALVGARMRDGLSLRSLLRVGPPDDEILAVANELDVDMIVIGTHGRRGLSRALLGSVAENVIRAANRPVLVMHGPKDQHALAAE